jgi:GTPase
VVNYSESRTLEEIIENSTKLITLIDLCGHQKYIKTTIFGLTGYSPDFALLVVSAVTGVGMYLLKCVLCTFLYVCCVV